MALENDTQAPDFELVNQYGEHIQLSQYRGDKSVALVFFPLAFSGICSGELCTLRDNLSLFENSGVELLGISVDSRHALRAWGEQENYGFNLLADFWPHGAVAKEYGVFLEEKGFSNRATTANRPGRSGGRVILCASGERFRSGETSFGSVNAAGDTETTDPCVTSRGRACNLRLTVCPDSRSGTSRSLTRISATRRRESPTSASTVPDRT